jgi:hypothetical protein
MDNSEIKRHVFISWSGEASRIVAQSLREWLPQVIQNTVPFMSQEDISKGSRGNEAIAAELLQASLGIICLTPDNIGAPWILFEAGALSNSLRAKDLVCPYLIGLRKVDVRPPLSLFQLTDSDKDDTRRLVQAINSSFAPDFRLTESALNRQFDKWWPELESAVTLAVNKINFGDVPAPARSSDDILVELLNSVRRMERDLAAPQVEDWNSLEELIDQSPPPVLPFIPGQKVRHPQFGTGIIREMMGIGRDVKAVIDFVHAGRKKIVVRYANLTAVDS